MRNGCTCANNLVENSKLCQSWRHASISQAAPGARCSVLCAELKLAPALPQQPIYNDNPQGLCQLLSKVSSQLSAVAPSHNKREGRDANCRTKRSGSALFLCRPKVPIHGPRFLCPAWNCVVPSCDNVSQLITNSSTELSASENHSLKKCTVKIICCHFWNFRIQTFSY